MENSSETKAVNFEEVENRLEQMFAGIEDESSSIKQNENTEFVNKSLEITEITCLAQELESKLESPAKSDQATISLKDKEKEIVKPQEVIANNKPAKKANGSTARKKKPSRNSKGLKRNAKPEKKKSVEQVNKKEEQNGRIRGPYIQIRDKDTIIVNNTSSEEVVDNKIKKLNTTSVKNEISKLKGLYVSTLSTKYDADTTDTSWLCVFCKKGPHKMRLGDLYGPYVIKKSEELIEESDLKSNQCTTNSGSENTKKKKRSESIEIKENETDNNFQKPISSNGMLEISENSYEIWSHEDCIIWANGVYLVGLKVIGLESAVWNSSIVECSYCLLNGAMICCLSRGCHITTHYPCAKLNDWSLNEVSFKTYCPDHANNIS